MFHQHREARPLRAGRLIALCALALLPLVGLFAAPAASASGGTPQIGVIDLDRIMNEYDGARLAQSHLENFRSEREKQFNSLQLGLGLPEKDFDAYKQDVLTNGKLDEKHITEQQAIAKKNMGEYQALKEKKDALTDAEKTRQAQLEKDVKAVSDALKTVYDQWSKDMDAELNRYLGVLNTTMDKAIEDLSKAKKYAVVLNKNVKIQDSAVRFVWGGNDITDEVIKSMNANFKPTMFDMGPGAPATPPQPATPAAK